MTYKLCILGPVESCQECEQEEPENKEPEDKVDEDVPAETEELEVGLSLGLIEIENQVMPEFEFDLDIGHITPVSVECTL